MFTTIKVIAMNVKLRKQLMDLEGKLIKCNCELLSAEAAIEDLHGEVAALRERLVVDDAMVERAMFVMYPGEWIETIANATTDEDAIYIAEGRREMRAALEAALNDDANG